MKRAFIFAAVWMLAFSVSACKKDQLRNTGSPQPENQKEKPDFRQFEQEGFISRDLFRVIVVRPSGSSMTDDEVAKQARTKAILSLKRYLTSSGKSIQPNTDAGILNLIDDAGKITPYEDRSASRTVYVLDITKPECKSYVDTLGR
jgi:hypothetical protein